MDYRRHARGREPPLPGGQRWRREGRGRLLDQRKRNNCRRPDWRRSYLPGGSQLHEGCAGELRASADRQARATVLHQWVRRMQEANRGSQRPCSLLGEPMKLGQIALVVACLACGSRGTAQSTGPAIERIEVLLRADSGSERMVVADRLKLPSQRPWQNGFYIAVYPSPAAANLLRAEVVGVSFDIRMGPQLYGGPDGELLLQSKIDEQGEWFRAATTSTKEVACSPSCPTRVVLGPFELPALIPGPRESEALLWPTRLRIHAQILGVPRPDRVRDAVPTSVSKAVAVSEISIN